MPPQQRVVRRKRRTAASSSTPDSSAPVSSRTKKARLAKAKVPSTPTSTLKANKAPAPSQPPPISYTPTQHTLFLADDNLTFTWHPVQSKQAGAVSLQRFFAPFKDDVHGYFVSAKAAKNAATTVGAISIYRHIGQVTLQKFQQLDGLPPQRQWFPGVKKTSSQYINLRIPLQACWCANEDVALALESLSSVQESPWPKPFIVPLAKREDILRACDVDNYHDDFDLEVQIYAGRLLFELIACPDIHLLFTHLKSRHPYDPVPTLPEYPAIFPRSPAEERTPNSAFLNILHKAESTGYAELTDEQNAKIEKGLSVKLYQYQRQTVRWMIDKEIGPYSLNEFFWEERSFTGASDEDSGKYYYFPLTGEVRLCKPPSTRGGMVTEEMGLGKTIEALALIVSQKAPEHKSSIITVHCEEDPPDLFVQDRFVRMTRTRVYNHERAVSSISTIFQHGDEILQDPDEIEFPADIKLRRWPAKTTLIVCPISLLGQWKHEIRTRAPSLTWVEWNANVNDDYPSRHAIGEHAKDVVFTTYEMVRSDSELSKISWKRLILDESQLTRRSSTQVARDVFNLRSEYRFLLTGTPLVNSISDLKGQLSFLKIWPFTLDSDGFWETYVMRRFHSNDNLIDKLLQVTMIRHSKSQKLGISLPERTYETITVSLTGSYRACYYYVLASCLEELHTDNYSETRLRSLLRLLLALCLSPYLLDCISLDVARRYTWARQAASTFSSVGIMKVSPQEAIQFVAESGGGLLVDSQRVFAVRGRDADNLYEMYMQMPMNELREYVIERNLLPYTRAGRTSRERLAALAAGGAYRLDTDTIKELRHTAVEVSLAPRSEIATWSRAKTIARLRQHYDLENGIQALRTIHESGLSSIMKVAENRGNPSCPVCLTDCEGRVAVTKCGHLYCFDCIMMLLSTDEPARRCAICRRPLSSSLTVEIMRKADPKKEAKAEKNESKLLEQGSPSKKAEAGVLQNVDVAEGGAAQQQSKGEPQGASSSLPLEEVNQSDMQWMSPSEMWQKFEACPAPPAAFNTIGRNEHFPSLSAEFLRHLAAVRGSGQGSPKLDALLHLIQSSSQDTKFCVVAGSIESLRMIFRFLESKKVMCVGAGVRRSDGGGSEWAPNTARTMIEGAERFVMDPDARVFLLNPGNATGLTLTAANVVVFMETIMKPAEAEIQAAARVHRIGQTKKVRVVRIVARNTLEQKIVDRRGKLDGNERSWVVREQSQETSREMLLRLFERDDSDIMTNNNNNINNNNNNNTLTWGGNGSGDAGLSSSESGDAGLSSSESGDAGLSSSESDDQTVARGVVVRPST